MKLAVVIAIYRPPRDFLHNVASYSKGVDHIYLWDNTPSGAWDENWIVNAIPNATYMHYEHINMGLGYAYNRAAEQARQDGYTHLMTMDQDTYFTHFDEYVNAIEQSPHLGIGIFSPSIEGGPRTMGLDCNTSTVQSGSVFDLKVLFELGGFNERLFIGMVDADIYVRVQKRGFHVYYTEQGGLVASLDYASRRRLGITCLVRTNYAHRLYYDSRNVLLLWRMHPAEKPRHGKIRFLRNRMKMIGKVLLFEHGRIEKVVAIMLGTVNGLLGRWHPYRTDRIAAQQFSTAYHHSTKQGYVL